MRIEDTIQKMTVGELEELATIIEEEKELAASDRIRAIIESHVGTPKDPLVQRLAAERLREMEKTGASLTDIGERYGVTRERVRQVRDKIIRPAPRRLRMAHAMR